jgi:hypothetical protein
VPWHDVSAADVLPTTIAASMVTTLTLVAEAADALPGSTVLTRRRLSAVLLFWLVTLAGLYLSASVSLLKTNAVPMASADHSARRSCRHERHQD